VTSSHFNNCLHAQRVKAIILETMTCIKFSALPGNCAVNIQQQNRELLPIQQFPAKRVRKR
jgi:hypothetical protein